MAVNLEHKLTHYVQSWSSYCITLWGWRKTLLSVVLGGVSVLALPPISMFFVLFFTLPSLLWLLDGAVETTLEVQSKANPSWLYRLWRKIYGAKSAFWVGLCFGFGYFFFGLLWVGEAFLVDSSTTHIAMLPFAVTILPLILSLFWGFAALTARIFWGGAVKNILTLSLSLTLWEFLRGHLFTGLPLNLMGFAFDFSTAMLQSAAIWGVYGLTFIVIFLSLCGSLVVNSRFQLRQVVLGLVITLIAIWGAGSVRLYLHPTQYHDDIVLRLVQGNIEQDGKWKIDLRDAIANRFLELSGRISNHENSELGAVTHIIWPESAMPFLLEPDSDFMRAAINNLPPNGHLITGAIRREIIAGKTEFFNSVLAFDANGNRLGKYDKHHLVPFGEYLPFEKWLNSLGINKLIKFTGSFKTGVAPSNIYLPNTPAFAAAICFEIIFSGNIVDRDNRPEWILNVTNDAWFGNSIGLYQHFAQAKMRAIEEGLPIIRVANTGITVVFDPLGRAVAQLPRGKTAILDSRLPQNIKPTIFVWLTSFL